ncbi:methylmalonyl Co-A mutase-associated GTPase MeaB [Patiriisocius hiemis]|uniref:Methylmalonyl Co-A mutase-associated GTPase MeaB n=1 Tax=Patiriisocius hiemis TaxID=3075604 RepID=A0ABU2YEY2_9FLAO|nr:methylmalonyl Co-A mutase-associated GTPase MeaB [Constantimarinum sp. W242]MDT0556747.1 methylmalonyl Co-A mutase-associated GTPase MeaB [Constantimarinum sp. W242]
MAAKKKSKALSEKQGVEKLPSLSQDAAAKIKEKRKQVKEASTITKKLIEGDKTALSQAITLIESTAIKHQAIAKAIIEQCLPYSNNAIRIGITGVPGVGKSTFIESFGKLLITENYKVAVLAVDPSSSVSKGSILGDKTRMEELVKEDHAFIRPSASGSSLGGVARKTREAIILCEAAGFNCILIETVGVGQSETAVHSMTDFFLLLKLAGAGDELQGIKRGIMEMADAIVINKADGDNVKAAKLAKTEFNRALHLYPPKESGWVPKTLTCSAITSEGVDSIFKMLQLYFTEVKENKYFQEKRNQQNKYWFLQTIKETLQRDFFEKPSVKKELELQLNKLQRQETTPFEAAQKILELR